MATPSKFLGSLFTLFFTGVMAPVLVRQFNEACDGRADAVPTLPRGATRLPEAEVRVMAQGIGATPEEAWYAAQYNALRTAVTPMVDAQTWAQEGMYIGATVRRDAGQLITRCQDLGCVRDGGLWRRDVAVFVARAELAAKLKAAHVRIVVEESP
jgi:hypothetical protein